MKDWNKLKVEANIERFKNLKLVTPYAIIYEGDVVAIDDVICYKSWSDAFVALENHCYRWNRDFSREKQGELLSEMIFEKIISIEELNLCDNFAF